MISLLILLFSSTFSPLSARAEERLIDVLYTAGSSTLVLKVNDLNSSLHTIEIMSLIGRKVKTIKYSKGEELITIQSTSEMPEGIYIILGKDVSGKIISTIKVTVNK
jgi:hypothetical protein